MREHLPLSGKYRPEFFIGDPDTPSRDGNENFKIYTRREVSDITIQSLITEYYKLRGFAIYPPRQDSDVYQILEDGRRTRWRVRVTNNSHAGKREILVTVQPV